MDDQLQITHDNNDISKSLNCVKIRTVRACTSLNSLATNFDKELRQMDIEDLILTDIKLVDIMRKIEKMRPNRILLVNGDNYIVVDLDVVLHNYVAMRKGKLLGTGTFDDCAKVLLKQIQKDFSGRFEDVHPEELDDDWIQNFCRVHCPSERTYKIISLH